MAEHTAFFNLVTFTPAAAGDGGGFDTARRAFLSLMGDFTLRVGMSPGVNRALVPFGEYEKLAPTIGKAGRIEFWFKTDPRAGGSTPDVSFDGVRVVEVAVGQTGVLAGEVTPRIIDLVLFLADAREEWTQGRGGRLYAGLLNPDAQEDGTPDDAAGKRSNADLVKDCVKAMGFGDVPANAMPPAIDAAPIATNLRWHGASAPAELAGLLEHCGCVLAPNPDRSISLCAAGEGAEPEIPAGRLVSDVPAGVTSRRGTTLVITSAPVAEVETIKIDGIGADNWEYVVQTIAEGQTQPGPWAPIDDDRVKTNYWSASTPDEQVRTKFKDVGETHRAGVRAQAFKHLRLDPKKFDPLVRKILRRRLDSKDDGKTVVLKNPIVEARVATKQPDGTWKNSSEKVRVPAAFLKSGNILQFDQLLGKLEGSEAQPDAETKFVRLGNDDLSITLTIERARTVEGRVMPKYTTYAFTRNLDGTVTALDEEAAVAAADAPTPDTVFLERPELRRVEDVAGGTDNYEAKKADALKIAENYFKGVADNSRVVVATGFLPVALNGKVVEVRYSQDSLSTTYVVDGLDSTLHGRATQRRSRSYGLAAGSSATIGEQQSDPIAVGSTGGSQPVVPIEPGAAEGSGGSGVLRLRFRDRKANEPGGDFAGLQVTLDANAATDPTDDKGWRDEVRFYAKCETFQDGEGI